MPPIVFTNCALFDPAHPTLREGYSVSVEGERITAVSDQPITLQGAQVIDVGGKTLMPGLTDAHAHVMAVSADFAAIERMPRSLVIAKAKVLMEEMLLRGYTTVRDAGGADWGLAEAVRTGLFRGPRLLVSGYGLSQTGGHGDGRGRAEEPGCGCSPIYSVLSRIADGVDGVRQAVRDELRKGANQIKVMASGGVASPTDPIESSQYSLPELRAIVEEAEAHGTYVLAHAYSARAIRRAVECGVRSVEHANLIDAETAAFVAQRGAFVVPTLVTYEMLYTHGAAQGIPAESLAKLATVRERGLQALELCAAAGVKIGHGTDLLGEMHAAQSREFSLKAKVLSPHAVLTAATATNAELFGLRGEIGVIAPGALADLLVVEGNPLQNVAILEATERLMLIMQGGAIITDRLGASR